MMSEPKVDLKEAEKKIDLVVQTEDPPSEEQLDEHTITPYYETLLPYRQLEATQKEQRRHLHGFSLEFTGPMSLIIFVPILLLGLSNAALLMWAACVPTSQIYDLAYFLIPTLRTENFGQLPLVVPQILLIMLVPYLMLATFGMTLLARRTTFKTRIDRINPKNLVLAPDGLKVQAGSTWKNAGLKTVHLFKWTQLESITIESAGAHKAEKQVRLSLAGRRNLSIRPRALPSHVEWSKLLNYAKEHCPNAYIDPAVFTLARPTGLPEHTYTQLWLESMAVNPLRERDNTLKEGDELQSGGYKIQKRLGTGGQGTAYLATISPERAQELALPLTSKEVVLKEYIFPSNRKQDVMKKMFPRFLKEASILRNMDSPNIVKLFDVFIEDHRAYIVIEHADGETLKDLVIRRGALPESEVEALAKQMCAMLTYIHNLSPPVVHQDFTPDNLILDSRGNLKLIDFNVARQSVSNRTGTIVGKQGYLPPEQFRGEPTAQSDLYAMGATLHFLLTGNPPEPMSVSHPKSVRPEISDWFDRLVAKATCLEASDRQASAEELLKELETRAQN